MNLSIVFLKLSKFRNSIQLCPKPSADIRQFSTNNRELFPHINKMKRQKINPKSSEGGIILDKLALTLLIIGGLNWGLVGIFKFDLVAWLFGGQTSIISRIVYVLVALAAIWAIPMLFRNMRRDTAEA